MVRLLAGRIEAVYNFSLLFAIVTKDYGLGKASDDGEEGFMNGAKERA